jgi:hypothetical protein
MKKTFTKEEIVRALEACEKSYKKYSHASNNKQAYRDYMIRADVLQDVVEELFEE